MQTRVYVDGFNLYYGALRRWQVAPKLKNVASHVRHIHSNKKDRQIIESFGVEMLWR